MPMDISELKSKKIVELNEIAKESEYSRLQRSSKTGINLQNFGSSERSKMD